MSYRFSGSWGWNLVAVNRHGALVGIVLTQDVDRASPLAPKSWEPIPNLGLTIAIVRFQVNPCDRLHNQNMLKATATRLGKRTWPLTAEHANAGKVMAYAIRAVKDLVSKNITPKGLTTAEIFELTQSIPNPPNFKPAILPQNATAGPFPDNLIRSQT